jgi:hypothetical protein
VQSAQENRFFRLYAHKNSGTVERIFIKYGIIGVFYTQKKKKKKKKKERK